MRRHERFALFALVAAMVVVLAACAETTPEAAPASPPTLAPGAIELVAGPVGAASPCARVDGPACAFEPANFSEPTVIDNPWLPMRPGMQWVYEGTTNEDELLEHQVIITVTDLTKVVNGIETVVSWDLDFSDGELVEQELAFFAQDDDGNVWRMGEHPEEFEDGEFVGAPTWLGGIDGASAGISMLGEPAVGMLSYSQGWAPPVEFIDRGRVDLMGQETCVAYDCFTDVLVIDEFNTEEFGAHQLKYFAPGVGNVRVGWAGNDETREELELVAMYQLDAEALLDVRAAALEIEAHAYDVSPAVYALTDPAIAVGEDPAPSLCSSHEGLSCSFARASFTNPTVIDNVLLPMTPGTQLVYEGTTNEEGELLDHRVVITVTDLTKVIDGVEAVVSWDLDYSDGDLVEAELAFFAQDDDGNVWRLGEHPEEYENGIVVDAPTWIAGIEGASAGVSMPGDPSAAVRSYSQGWAPTVGFNDRARVGEIGSETCVAAGCYSDVLVVEEFNIYEPGASQLKYFAPGVGNVAVAWAGADTTQEVLELVSVAQLDAAAMDDVRNAAIELEEHAYAISPNVYGLTGAMRLPGE
jgi:hypothetical protein